MPKKNPILPDPAVVEPEAPEAWSVLLEDPFGPPAPPPKPPKPPLPDARKRAFTLGDRFAQGDVCDLFHYVAPDIDGVLKIARSAQDNDLVENEARVLDTLYPPEQGDEKFYRYLPRLFDAFLMQDAATGPRRATVLPYLKEYRGLDEVRQAHSKGLDYLDVLWMAFRMLAGIGFVHVKGFVHGAVLPPHVMVDPRGHGAKFIDWCYAVPTGDRVKAISPAYRVFYAPEILEKKPVSAATDLYMVGKCIVAVLGGDVPTNEMPSTVPTPFREFVSKFLVYDKAGRPTDAWALHDELEAVLRRMGVERKYRVLDMPPRT
jgi:serine/threonine protein kinase